MMSSESTDTDNCQSQPRHGENLDKGSGPWAEEWKRGAVLGERQKLSYRKLKLDAQVKLGMPNILRLRVRLRWVRLFLQLVFMKSDPCFRALPASRSATFGLGHRLIAVRLAAAAVLALLSPLDKVQ